MRIQLILCILFISCMCYAEDKVMIQVRFTEKVQVKGMGQPLEYSDCLYYTPDEWANLDPKDLEAKKQERIANWKAIVENPAPQPEPTKEQLKAEQSALDEQIVSIEARKSEITDKLSIMKIE